MKKIIALLLALLLVFTGCDLLSQDGGNTNGASSGGAENLGTGETIDLGTYGVIPAYAGEPFVYVNGGTPIFSAAELTTTSYESYSPLDTLGRCGVCIASVGIDIMPTEDRGNISNVRPTGWHSVEYECVPGGNLYNRCHLIGFQLTGENANNKNLITGTRYLNIEGMLPFENMIADYVKETENHVALRVTPIFEGNNMVATGVLMEAQSVEDDGEEISFAVFCYNVQPGVVINYVDGSSALSADDLSSQPPIEQGTTLYVLNTNSKKIHRPECSSVTDMAEHNKQETYETITSLQNRGYTTCGSCNPK